MDQPATTRQQQHRDAVPISSAAGATGLSSQQQQTKRKPLTIHTPPPPPPHTIPHTRPATTYEAKPRRSSSISSQTSSIFSQSQGNDGFVSSLSSPFLPASPLFRTGYSKLGGSTVGMGTTVGSMPGAIGVGVGGSFPSYLGQRSSYGTSPGRRGLSSSTLSLLSSHPSSPGVPPVQGTLFTTGTRMPFDVEAIDVSESEGEQDAVASIDGDDESESSGSEEGDDDGFSSSDKDDSDSDDQEDSGVESPLSTYDPIPAASLLSSSAPSPSMMTGRLGLFGGVQQTHNGDILRRSQEIERHGSFSQKDLSSPSHDQRKGIDLVLDVQAATTTAFVENEQGIPWTVSEQDDHDSVVDDTASLGSAPSPALSHFTPAYSAQSTAPSSPSLPVSPYSLESKHIPDSRLPQGLSPSTDCNSNIPDTMDGADETSEHLFSETAPMSVPLTPLVSRIPTLVLSIDQHATPISPPQKQNDEQEDNVESNLSTSGAELAHRSTEDLVDEGVFEEEDVRCHHSRSDSCKTQDVDSQRTIEAETHPDGYGSLPKYSTHPSPTIVQQHHDDTAHDHSSTSSTSDAVVAELKEVRAMLQDLHKRMDRLERTLFASPPPLSGSQKDNLPHSVARRRGGVLSIIRGIAGLQRGGGGGGRLIRIAMFLLFVGLIVFGRRRWTRRNVRSLLGMDWATARQSARSRLGFLERRVLHLRL